MIRLFSNRSRSAYFSFQLSPIFHFLCITGGRLYGWVGVTKAQGVALLFNECQYWQWWPGRKVFTWDRNLQSTISFVLWQWIAICDTWRFGFQIAIHDTRSENWNIFTKWDQFFYSATFIACLYWLYHS